MHSKIPVNKNPCHRNKLIDLQCKSTDWFLYDRSFYRQECSDCKIYSNNVKQRSSKPIFSWKHSFTNQYIAIKKFFEKNWVCYLLREKTFPSCRKNSRSLSRSSLSFFFVPLVPLASFFCRFVLDVFLSVVFEEPGAHQKIIFSDYLFPFLFFPLRFFFQPPSAFHWIPHCILCSSQKILHLIAMTRMANALELILRNMAFDSLKKTCFELSKKWTFKEFKC